MSVNFAGRVRDRKRSSKPHSDDISNWYENTPILVRSGMREDHTSSYFSHNNIEATRLRDQLSADSLEMLIQWLKEGGNVGIHGTDPVS